MKYSDVRISQQEVDVLEEVNLELSGGEFVYLIGKVGSGKSTFLKTIYGEVPVDLKSLLEEKYKIPFDAKQLLLKGANNKKIR